MEILCGFEWVDGVALMPWLGNEVTDTSYLRLRHCQLKELLLFSSIEFVTITELQLLETADKSTQDVQGLHAKLDRKREVENKNVAVQEQFQSGITQSIRTMAEDLEMFAEQQTSTTANVFQNLGMCF